MATCVQINVMERIIIVIKSHLYILQQFLCSFFYVFPTLFYFFPGMWLVKIKTSRGGKELLFSGNVIACNEEEGNKKGDNQKI